ncbi:MAG: XRE family transcriptional regulator [Micrococcales bacterium]|nr:XRE family transcriptional regulator [Micrococcales bacterium]
MSTAEKLKQARTSAGLTQRKLAALTGIAQPRIAAYETGRVSPTSQTETRLLKALRLRPSVVLDRQRADVIEVFARHGVEDVRLIGSVARGEDEPDSDIDFLVRFPSGFDLLDLVALDQGLREVLNIEVDLVSEAGVGRATAAALAEARPL